MEPHNNIIGVTIIADNNPLNKNTTANKANKENINIASLKPKSGLNGMIAIPMTIRLNIIATM